MILIYHICRYIMLPQFISYCSKSEICPKYLRIISRMKAAYIIYFQYSFQEIFIINMYLINSRFSDYPHVLQGSVVDHEGHTIQLGIIAIQSSLY